MTTATLTCNHCQFNTLCLPGHLGHNDVELFQRHLQRTPVFHKGDNLYKTGELFSGIYVVVSGTVKAFKLDASGQKQIIDFYHAGEVIGLDSISSDTYKTTAVALDTCVLCKLPFAHFDELSINIPEVARLLLNLMSSQLNNTSIVHLNLNQKTAQQKLAYFLIELDSRLKNRVTSANSFILAMTRTDIGNYLGLTIETVSRFINKLQKDNLIKITGKQVEIIDLNGLKQLVEQ
ncbi:helix-turn-helix domain-containing protein [Paraferrimonas sp. SM1919]|uniref:helix-turn-helix domain-containing protein n=1 Tax=Paraferrimonas sp. SM1919 TaxID=2662263 RepID=UPI0013D5F6DB|nr:helix-turn-helix domain-containing protein [Paraferrimonas sp. SM1919]